MLCQVSSYVSIHSWRSKVMTLQACKKAPPRTVYYVSVTLLQ
uniref:Uncharacterized protein n=1 Tax=Anguilla anguilla TaxID=7936 RepID=A0A0E9VFC9_ANGAN